MAERPWSPGEAELEQALVELGRQMPYPPAPDLAEAVRQRLVANGVNARRRSRWGWPSPGRRRRVALAAAALLVFAGGVLAGSLGVGTAVARWLGLPGVMIVSHSGLPSAVQHQVGGRLALGQRLLLPTLPGLGTPDEVYLDTPRTSGQVALLYRGRAGLPPAGRTGVGLLLTEFHGSLHETAPWMEKFVGQGTLVEAVTVNGHPGYWISGRAHVLVYRDPATGLGYQESLRLAGNTLLWEQDGLVLRLESALRKTDALRIAASVR